MQILGGYTKYNISSSCSRFIVEVTPFIIQYFFNMHESNGWCIEFMLIHLCHAKVSTEVHERGKTCWKKLNFSQTNWCSQKQCKFLCRQVFFSFSAYKPYFPKETLDQYAYTANEFFGRGIGLDDPQRCLPTPTILWFCECYSTISHPSNW